MVPACPLLFCEPVGLTVLSRRFRRSDTWETPLLSLPVQTHPVSAQGKVHPHVPVLLTATHPLHLQPNIILACLPIVSLAFPPGGGGFWGCKPTLVTGPTGPRADGPLLFVSQSIQLIERESNQRAIGWMKEKKTSILATFGVRHPWAPRRAAGEGCGLAVPPCLLRMKQPAIGVTDALQPGDEVARLQGEGGLALTDSCSLCPLCASRL